MFDLFSSNTKEIKNMDLSKLQNIYTFKMYKRMDLSKKLEIRIKKQQLSMHSLSLQLH